MEIGRRHLVFSSIGQRRHFATFPCREWSSNNQQDAIACLLHRTELWSCNLPCSGVKKSEPACFADSTQAGPPVEEGPPYFVRSMQHSVRILPAILASDATAMDKKRPVADLDNVPNKRRFRVDALDLFVSGDVSGMRAQRLFHHAALAGSAHVQDLAKPEGCKNSHRDLLRKALKSSLWPKPYETEVLGWDVKSGTEKTMRLAYYLPHEMVHAMLQVSESSDIVALQEETLPSRQDLLEHLRGFETQFGLRDVVALGLWMDGVPFNHDRSQSLECISMNFPSLPKEYQDVRLPVTCFPKFFLAKGKTWDSVLKPIVWSMRCLLFGRFPQQRHDNKPFTQDDAARKRLAGSAIGMHCALSEVRGDWSMFKDVLRFPGWQGKGPVCFLCSCTLATLHDVGSDAAWRTVF